jgi:hypothetical protein
MGRQAAAAEQAAAEAAVRRAEKVTAIGYSRRELWRHRL